VEKAHAKFRLGSIENLAKKIPVKVAVWNIPKNDIIVTIKFDQ
jgi:hypothetical protein